MDVRVPTTGNAGEDAVITEILVAQGDQVSAGQVLVVLETAKAALEIEAPASGTVQQILAAVGDEVAEHSVLVILGSGDPGEDHPRDHPGGSADDPGDTAPALAVPGVEAHTELPQAAVDATPGSDRPRRDDGRLAASPRARILAERNQIDLASVTPSGPGGRIIVGDVLNARAARASATPASEPATSASGPATPAAELATPALQPASSAAEPPPESRADSEFELIPVKGARRVTAERMLASLQQSAQLTLTRYADADPLLSFAARLRATATEGAPKIGVNDLLLFAAARVLAAHPEANSTFEPDGIRRYRRVNLGFAVDTGHALLVPVIRAADTLGLAELASAAQSAIASARAGKLTGPEMSDGTFTVTNLGGLGVHWFTPVLNLPQTCILGVGAAHRAHPEASAQLPLSLTFDHRALDGAAAAQVLADLARAIETIDVLPAYPAPKD